MDFSKLSDEELKQIAGGNESPDMSSLSTEELQKIANPEKDSSMLSDALDYGMRGLDYAGGIVRTGIANIEDAALPVRNKILEAVGSDFREKPMYQEGDWSKALSGEAPTSSEQAQRMGLPEMGKLSDVAPGLYSETGEGLPLQKGGFFDPTTRGVVGLGRDIIADPITHGALGATGSAVKNTVKSTKNIIKSGAESLARTSVGEATVGAGKATKETFGRLFNPKIAKDFEELTAIADKHGIARDLLPDSVEFGQNSMIGRAQRVKMEGPLGEEALNKFNDGLDAVRGKLEENISKIGGGTALNEVDAGLALREGFDKGVDNFFSNIDMTHNKVIEAIPNLQVAPKEMAKIESKLAGLEKWAKGQVKRGITNADRAQGQQILRAVEAVRNGSGSYKQMYESMKQVGDVAFKSKNQLADIAPDIQKFRDLYGTISDGLINTVDATAGKPVGDSLRESNKLIHEFLGDRSIVSKLMGSKSISNEALFRSLVLNGDTKKIEALKKILPAEDFQKLKGAFLNSMVQKNADEVFTFKGFHNKLRGKTNQAGALLDPSEAQDIMELVKLGNRFGDPILSYSGTGASNTFRDITKSITGLVQNDAIVNTLKKRARAAANPEALAPAVEKIAVPSVGKSKALVNYSLLAKVSPAAARFLSSGGGEPSADKKANPLRGSAKWKVEGFANLYNIDRSGLFKDPRFVNKLVTSKEGQRILLSAQSAKDKRLSALLNEATMLNKGGK